MGWLAASPSTVQLEHPKLVDGACPSFCPSRSYTLELPKLSAEQDTCIIDALVKLFWKNWVKGITRISSSYLTKGKLMNLNQSLSECML